MGMGVAEATSHDGVGGTDKDWDGRVGLGMGIGGASDVADGDGGSSTAAGACEMSVTISSSESLASEGGLWRAVSALSVGTLYISQRFTL